MPLISQFETNSSQEPHGQKPRSTGTLASVWLFVWDFLKVFIIALAIIIPVRFYLFQPFIVTGLSMEPNFEEGEYLIIDEISYRFSEPVRGEVTVIRAPTDGTQFFIKRIIGLPGETVEITGGKIFIYNKEHLKGFALNEDYLPKTVATFGTFKVTLSKDEYYLLGDNRMASSDSRSFGPINKSRIVGRVLLRAFPMNRFGPFRVPDYAY